MSPRSLQATIDEQPAIAAPAPSAGPRALARWLQLGADPTASAGETRRVVMVNTLALVSFGITLIYVSLYLFMSWWGPLALTVVALCCYGLVFQCHRSGFLQLAPRLLMATAIGHLSALSTLFLSGHAGVHLYLLVVLPFTFMTVRASDRVGRGLILSGALIGLAFCELQPLFGDPPYLVAVSKAELGIFHSVCVISLSVFLTVICASFGRELFVAQKRLKVQHARSESLLLSILPAPIAERLKADEAPIADDHAAAAVLFADVVGFTSLAATLEARDLVAILARYFVAYDHLAARHGVEKIKTIGDAYMLVGGVPTGRPDHAEAVADMALDMRDRLHTIQRPRRRLVAGSRRHPHRAGRGGRHRRPEVRV